MKNKIKGLNVLIAAIIVMMIVPMVLAGCGATKPKVSQEVKDGCNKFIAIFDKHKNDKYSAATETEMSDYVKFVNQYQEKATAEEKQILDKLGEVMFAYSNDSSEVAKGGKATLFDAKEKELKDLLAKY